jgi:DnaJ like chaperone protein
MTAVFIGNLVGMVLGYLMFKHWFAGVIGYFAGGWAVRQILEGLNQGGAFGGFSFSGGGHERQKVFFESMFLAMGHLAKADGHVSEEEIQVARTVMHQWGLRPEEVRVAIDLFTRGKHPDFPLETQIQRLRDACHRQPELLRAFLEILLEIPLSSGGIETAEREVLWRIASGLGVSRVEMAQLEALARARHSFGSRSGPAPSREFELEQAYKALDVDPGASDKAVKTAYRRLMNQHHPDKLVAKGLPESMMEAAHERTREIRAAYERIRDHRGFK